MFAVLCAAGGGFPRLAGNRPSVCAGGSFLSPRLYVEVAPDPDVSAGMGDAHAAKDVSGRHSIRDPSLDSPLADAPCGAVFRHREKRHLECLGALASGSGALFSSPYISPREAPFSPDTNADNVAFFKPSPHRARREIKVLCDSIDREFVDVCMFHAREIVLKDSSSKFQMHFSS